MEDVCFRSECHPRFASLDDDDDGRLSSGYRVVGFFVGVGRSSFSRGTFNSDGRTTASRKIVCSCAPGILSFSLTFGGGWSEVLSMVTISCAFF